MGAELRKAMRLPARLLGLLVALVAAAVGAAPFASRGEICGDTICGPDRFCCRKDPDNIGCCPHNGVCCPGYCCEAEYPICDVPMRKCKNMAGLRAEAMSVVEIE